MMKIDKMFIAKTQGRIILLGVLLLFYLNAGNNLLIFILGVSIVHIFQCYLNLLKKVDELEAKLKE